jgi:ABC-type amino acid transport substrate-binding protein
VLSNKRGPYHPGLPDRVLDLAQERRVLLAQLARLPSRHALVADREAGRAEVLVTPSVPLEELARRAATLPPGVRDAFRRGRVGVAAADVRARPLLFSSPAGQATGSGVVVELDRRPRASRRPALELP